MNPLNWGLSAAYPKDNSGNFSTSAATLKAFRLKKKIRNDKLDLIIKLRENLSRIEKLKAALKIRKNKVFTNIKLAGARTGRLTTSSPNLQGLSLRYKSLIKATKGKVFLIMDLGQAELKIIAHLTQEPTMLKIFAEGLDIHSYFGAVLLKVDYEDFMAMKKTDKERYTQYRSIAKVLNFSLLYGMGIPSLEERLLENGIDTTRMQATQFYRQWHETFKGIKAYHQKMKEIYNKENRGDIFQTYEKESQLKKYLTSLGGFKDVRT